MALDDLTGMEIDDIEMEFAEAPVKKRFSPDIVYPTYGDFRLEGGKWFFVQYLPADSFSDVVGRITVPTYAQPSIGKKILSFLQDPADSLLPEGMDSDLLISYTFVKMPEGNERSYKCFTKHTVASRPNA